MVGYLTLCTVYCTVETVPTSKLQQCEICRIKSARSQLPVQEGAEITLDTVHWEKHTHNSSYLRPCLSVGINAKSKEKKEFNMRWWPYGIVDRY